jgi:hypothetical protein
MKTIDRVLAVGMLVAIGATLSAYAADTTPVAPPAPPVLLFGYVTAVTGSPATSFTEAVPPAPVLPPVADAKPVTPPAPVSDTIAIAKATTFTLPESIAKLPADSLPFTPSFSDAAIFAGQNVVVKTAEVTKDAATAEDVALLAQLVSGTISKITPSTAAGGFDVIDVTLVPDSLLATLTGQKTVTVYISDDIKLPAKAPAVTDVVSFGGYLFEDKGALALVVDFSVIGPIVPIGPPPPAK